MNAHTLLCYTSSAKEGFDLLELLFEKGDTGAFSIPIHTEFEILVYVCHLVASCIDSECMDSASYIQ